MAAETAIPQDESSGCDEGTCAFAVEKAAAVPHLPSSAVVFLSKSNPSISTSKSALENGSATQVGQLAVWWPESLRAHLFLQNLRN